MIYFIMFLFFNFTKKVDNFTFLWFEQSYFENISFRKNYTISLEVMLTFTGLLVELFNNIMFSSFSIF